METLDALRERNKDLLKQLKKRSAKLHQLTLSRPEEEDGRQNSVIEPLTEITGDQSADSAARASLARASTDPKTNKLSVPSKTPAEDQQNPQTTESSGLTAYSSMLQDAGNSRWTGHSRSERLILPRPAPHTRDRDQGPQREVDRGTTLSSMLETDTTSDRQLIQPLLGYDWIAGLLDVESSLSERSEQFFSELQTFRQVNQDECIHSSLSGPPFVADLASSTLEGDKPQQSPDTHQCTFCYRINSRLFAVPLDAQAACPVCRMPKSEHPHTETEPAFIRVSIPRSTLLPAYKYKAHRRSSFDPSDSLGLPSHCLSGWSNPTLNSGSLMSSLDLQGSVATAVDTVKSTSFTL